LPHFHLHAVYLEAETIQQQRILLQEDFLSRIPQLANVRNDAKGVGKVGEECIISFISLVYIFCTANEVGSHNGKGILFEGTHVRDGDDGT